METTTLNQCSKYVADWVVMRSVQHNKFGLTLSAKLSKVLRGIHKLIRVKWCSRSLNTNSKNCFTSTVVQEDSGDEVGV